MDKLDGGSLQHPGAPVAEPRSGLQRWRVALRTYAHNVRADFELMREGRAKYLGDAIGPHAFPSEVVKRVGLQMMVAIRTMHLFRDAGVLPAAQLASRAIRHAYGAEIHWSSRWDAGVNIVHGNGLVVGSGAHIAYGCVLLQNVTLGDAFDHETGRIGGPALGPSVHVGPNSVLLGPIRVGEHSKIMAGSTLDHSVPPRSLVRPAAVIVSSRDN